MWPDLPDQKYRYLTQTLAQTLTLTLVDWSIQVIIASCVNQMLFVGWRLNVLWLILIDNNLWLFWAHLNRACLNHPFDSATNTTMGKSMELSIDLKDHIIDLQKSGKSLAAISKQLQVPKSNEQTTVCKYSVNGTVVSMPRSGRKQTISCCWEKTGQDGQESTKNH